MSKKVSDRLADFIHCYTDKDLKNELIIDSAGKPFLQIPKITDAGKEGVVDIYVVNRFEHDFHIENVDSLDVDMEIRAEQTVLRQNEPVKLHVIFRPGEDRMTPLDSHITIRGRFVIK